MRDCWGLRAARIPTRYSLKGLQDGEDSRVHQVSAHLHPAPADAMPVSVKPSSGFRT